MGVQGEEGGAPWHHSFTTTSCGVIAGNTRIATFKVHKGAHRALQGSAPIIRSCQEAVLIAAAGQRCAATCQQAQQSRHQAWAWHRGLGGGGWATSQATGEQRWLGHAWEQG